MDKVEINKIIEKIIELSLNGMSYKEALSIYIGTDQSNQCTHENIQEDYNTI